MFYPTTGAGTQATRQSQRPNSPRASGTHSNARLSTSAISAQVEAARPQLVLDGGRWLAGDVLQR